MEMCVCMFSINSGMLGAILTKPGTCITYNLAKKTVGAIPLILLGMEVSSGNMYK